MNEYTCLLKVDVMELKGLWRVMCRSTSINGWRNEEVNHSVGVNCERRERVVRRVLMWYSYVEPMNGEQLINNL